MPAQQQTQTPPTRRKRLTATALWSLGFTAVGAIITASWHLTPMATLAYTAVISIGMAIPLGIALGILLPAGMAANRGGPEHGTR